ncbi:MAG: hypothetical protein GX587_04455 [Bacteroidales bacterium]|nr:hypothetical protein [Bacteroidales bacterium]
MKNKILIIGLISALFISCEKEKEKANDIINENENVGEIIDITSECEFPEDFLTVCFCGCCSSEHKDYVFRDNDSFQEFGEAVRTNFTGCSTASLPCINFSKYTLLKLETNASGGTVTYDRKVIKDTGNRKIIYHVSVHYEGMYMIDISNSNWAIVPKIPDNYTVEFVSETNQKSF